MNYMSIRVEKIEAPNQVALLTLDRPERLNAISHELLMETIDFFQEIRNDNKTRIVIVRGEGRAFVLAPT